MLVSIVIVVLVVILAAVGWRYAVRHMFLPCPPCLISLLENPYMTAVAGSSLILDRALVERGMTVLDVGCGPGRLAIPAAERVGMSGLIVALDIQEGMLRRLKERVAQRRLTNIRTVLAGAGEGAVERNRFDRVFLVTVLGEIPNKTQALREIYDALKPEGILSVTEVIPDPHYQRPSTVQARAEEAGFRLKGVHGGMLAFTMNFGKDTDT